MNEIDSARVRELLIHVGEQTLYGEEGFAKLRSMLHRRLVDQFVLEESRWNRIKIGVNYWGKHTAR